MSIMMTRERAREIWECRSYSGFFAVSPEEDGFIRDYLKSMPQNACWADAVLKIANGGMEDCSLEGIGNSLVVACYRFIEQPPVSLSQDEERELAFTLKDGATGLAMFAYKLRRKLVEISKELGNVDSTRFWMLINAIRVWQGVHMGVWPYLTEFERHRYLGWSLDVARKAADGGVS